MLTNFLLSKQKTTYTYGVIWAQVVPDPVDRALLRPGRIVWAQVEGHDWWPARVVRRRAVPREVGPPPGGPPHVLSHLPVVFFTARGLPREVDERLDTLEGLVAASMRSAGVGEALTLTVTFTLDPDPNRNPKCSQHAQRRRS